MAVLEFYDDGDFRISYETEITDSVIGYLTDEEVCTYLDKIKEL